MRKIDINNADDIVSDISSLVGHIASLSVKDKEWFSKVYFREVIKSQHYAVQSQDESTIYVNYVDSQELLDNARYIVDWLAGLQNRDPNQHNKLERITFQQALRHSSKWHDELTKKAEKSDRYIEYDAENAPKVLNLGDGWEVFWLKTGEARDIEGEIMGHCVGSGAYDDLDEGEAVFSIRKNNVAHITLHTYKFDVLQVVTKGNDKVPERYQHLVDEAAKILGVKQFIGRPLEDLSPIIDGWHENKKGDQFRIENGAAHSDGNQPAVIYKDGTKEWYKNGRRHREGDLPAVIRANGVQIWCKNDKVHRDDGPAVILADGTQVWWVNEKRHRLDGPAVIQSDGTQVWYQNDKLHREDGPAIIGVNGKKEWYQDNKLHREDGPAVIWEDGTQEWWLDGRKHPEEDFCFKINFN